MGKLDWLWSKQSSLFGRKAVNVKQLEQFVWWNSISFGCPAHCLKKQLFKSLEKPRIFPSFRGLQRYTNETICARFAWNVKWSQSWRSRHASIWREVHFGLDFWRKIWDRDEHFANTWRLNSARLPRLFERRDSNIQLGKYEPAIVISTSQNSDS